MEKKCIVPLLAWGKKCRPFSFFLLFILFAPQLFAQSVRVSGTVKDNKGSGIQGVNVSVKNSTTGTTTDNTGKFSLDVPSTSSVLVFSSVGFLSKEVIVGEQKMMEVAL